MSKRVLSVLLAVIMILSVPASCSRNDAPSAGDRIITDSAGRQVTVPENPVSICTICPFSGQMAVLLGCGDRITSTCNNVARSNLLCEICPGIKNAVVVKNSGSINAEEVLSLNTDLIIVNLSTYENADEKSKLETMGIPYIVIGFETVEEQLDAVSVLGKALNCEDEAEEYINWFRGIIDKTENALTNVSAVKRIYHSVNEAVRTDTKGSYCDEWISYTKAVNVSTDGTALRIDGNKAYTTLEQIYAWNPDIIICNEAKVDDYILSDSKWQGLGAVNEGAVYQIPIGVTRWGHPNSVETPLAILWLAKLLYPEVFTEPLEDEIIYFYKTFYDFDIDDGWITAMLNGDEMRTPKTEAGGEAA